MSVTCRLFSPAAVCKIMALKILLVGTGITSAVTGALLRQRCRDQVRLIVWDKAKGTGGRMSTSRSPLDANCVADLGAQYITSSPENLLAHQDVYNNLIVNGVLEPLSAKLEGLKDFPLGTQHFVAPRGMSSVVKHLFLGVADETHFNRHICSITEQDKKWKVGTKSGVEEFFDIVVLTVPVPQILDLSGTIQEIIAKNCAIENGFKTTKYSSRYALGLFYNGETIPNVPWDVKYLTGDEIIRYISFDNKKRNRPNQPTAIVFHTSIAFGAEHIEKTPSDIEPSLLNHVKKLFPSWPEPASIKCHKWKFSQVLNPFPGSPGFVTLRDHPLLIAGGDGFTNSNFDGCISSAVKLCDEVTKSIDVNV